MDRTEALEHAYDGGLLAGKAEFVIEGVSKRQTNWGRGMTVIVKGATASQATEAVRRFGFVANGDARNGSHPKGRTVYLTTFAEGEALAGSLGIGVAVSAAASDIPQGSSVSIRLADHAADILVAVLDGIAERVEGLPEGERLAFDGLLINAFQQGMLGLALGSGDIEALNKGEGLLDRYVA